MESVERESEKKESEKVEREAKEDLDKKSLHLRDFIIGENGQATLRETLGSFLLQCLLLLRSAVGQHPRNYTSHTAQTPATTKQ